MGNSRSVHHAIALTALVLAAPATGEWRRDDLIDKMTDVRTPMLVTEGALGSAMALACPRKGEVDVVFLTGEYLGEGFRELMVRFDDDPPQNGYARYRDKSARVSAVNRPKGAFTINRVLTADRTMVRLFDYRFNQIDLSFDTAEGRDKITQLLGSCGIDMR